MADAENKPTDSKPEPQEPGNSDLPRNAPRRARQRIDFGRPPIGGSSPDRIIGHEHKHRGGPRVDV